MCAPRAMLRSMNATILRVPAPLQHRLAALDWPALGRELDINGCAVLPAVLTATDCERLIDIYGSAERFRSRVVMARHGYGRGEYQYFSYPLPDIVAQLRTALYACLVPVANRWNTA